MSHNFGGKKFKIPKIRGHVGCDDFFTIISRDDAYDSQDNDHGIPVKNNKQRENIRSFLESFTGRFCLSMTKYNGNQHGGELRNFPKLDFDKKWDDESLCELFGITQKEYKEILRVIPDYY
jgi:hypothetical protein